MCHNICMTKKYNWNMLHFDRCPLCRGKLVPANADGELLECRNAYNETIRCEFMIRSVKLYEICRNMRAKVYA